MLVCDVITAWVVENCCDEDEGVEVDAVTTTVAVVDIVVVAAAVIVVVTAVDATVAATINICTHKKMIYIQVQI